MSCGPTQYNNIISDTEPEPPSAPLSTPPSELPLWNSGRGGNMPGQGFNLGRSEDNGPLGTSFKEVSFNVTNIVAGTPAIVDDNGVLHIYSVDAFGVLSRYSTENAGTLPDVGISPVWSQNLGGVFRGGVSIGANGHLYMIDFTGNLHSYDTDGNQRYSFGLGGGFTSGVVFDSNGLMYFGSQTGVVYCVDDNSGNPRIVWQEDLSAHGKVESDVTIVEDRLIIVGMGSTTTGSVIALDADKDAVNRVVWKAFEPDQYNIGAIAYYNVGNPSTEMLVMASDDGGIYVYDVNGNLKWQEVVDSGVPVKAPPSISRNGDIFVVSHDGLMRSYALSGASRWAHDFNERSTSGPIIDARGHLYYSSVLKLHTVEDSAGGAVVLNTMSLGSNIMSSPVVINSSVLLSVGGFGVNNKLIVVMED